MLQTFKYSNIQLAEDDIVLIESIAQSMMKTLEYEMHRVGVSVEPIVYTAEQEDQFALLNKEGTPPFSRCPTP